MIPEKVFIIADIEGSSGCWSYRASEFLNNQWYSAAYNMTLDVAAVTEALLEAGVKKIYVKDFHRTAFNVMKEFFPAEVEIISGYIRGPIPGIGDARDGEKLMLTGMHASSGSRGFLPHTFTSRIKELNVNGKSVAEVELFSSSLGPFGLKPVFFSGCPVACKEAEEKIAGIETYAIDKSGDPFAFDKDLWRRGLASAAVASLSNEKTEPFLMKSPFKVRMSMRDGASAAEKLASRWKLQWKNDTIIWDSPDFEDLYQTLISVCYFTPFTGSIMPVGLPLYNFMGWAGLHRARMYLKKRGYLFS